MISSRSHDSHLQTQEGTLSNLSSSNSAKIRKQDWQLWRIQVNQLEHKQKHGSNFLLIQLINKRFQGLFLKDINRNQLSMCNYKFSFQNKVSWLLSFHSRFTKTQNIKRCSTLVKGILSFAQIITKVGKLHFTTWQW